MEYKFEISDCDNSKLFRGMKIGCSEKGYQNQSREVYGLFLEKIGLTDCRAVDTPLPDERKLSKKQSLEDDSEEKRKLTRCDYRGLVDSLKYLSLSSGPDIANSSHSQQFSRELWWRALYSC